MGGKSRKTVKKGPNGPPATESSARGSNGILLQGSRVASVPRMRIRTEMSVAELVLNVRHEHRALSGTLCVEPFIVNSVIRSVLEDEFGYMVRVLISDIIISSATFKKSKDLYRYAKGRRVVINEPWYTVCEDGLTVVIVDDCRDVSGKVIVCEPPPFCNGCEDNATVSSVDGHQDIRRKRDQEQDGGEVKEGRVTKETVLSTQVERAALTPSAEAERIRCEGNSLFTKHDFVGAMEFYTDCITKCLQLLLRSKGHDANGRIVREEEEPNVKKTLMLAYSNRSEAWLRCRNFDYAQSDARKALELDPKHIKSLVRNGKALFELQSYEESAACFSSALEESPDDQQAQIVKTALARSKTYLDQSRDGIYDLNDYSISSGSKQPPECSDFVGSLEIRQPSGKMRGLFATKDIRAGELVVVSNAIAVYNEDMGHDHDRSDSEEEDRECGECDVCEKHKTWAKRKVNSKRNLCHVDELAAQVISFAGTSRRQAFQVVNLRPDEKKDVPSIDLYRPGINWTPPVDLVPPNQQIIRFVPKDDVVREIVKENFIDEIVNDARYFTNGEQKRIFSGVWLLPSLMKRSCCANTEARLVGEVMFIRACRAIAPGEEVTRSYVDTLKGLKL